MPGGAPGVTEQGQGCVWVYPRGSDREEGWPEPSRAREEQLPHLRASAPAAHTHCGKGLVSRGKHPGERLHIQQGNSLFGRQLSLAAELPHLCPLQERKKLSPGAARRSRACGTFHLMRILFILSGATNLSSEHFVLIKN